LVVWRPSAGCYWLWCYSCARGHTDIHGFCFLLFTPNHVSGISICIGSVVQVSSLTSEAFVPAWLVPVKTPKCGANAVVNLEVDWLEEIVTLPDDLASDLKLDQKTFPLNFPVLRPTSTINSGCQILRDNFPAEIRKKAKKSGAGAKQVNIEEIICGSGYVAWQQHLATVSELPKDAKEDQAAGGSKKKRSREPNNAMHLLT
jgi:hypothetical protein